MDNWNHAKELAKKVEKNSDSRFVKLAEDEEKAVGIFLGGPFAREVHWSGERYVTCIGEGCKFCGSGKKPSLRVAINFFQLPEKELRIMENGRKWFEDLLKVREKYGLENWAFEVQRHGASGETSTSYTILPEEKITEALRAEISKLELFDLEAVLVGEKEKDDYNSYKSSKKTAEGAVKEEYISPHLASALIPRLKAMPRSAVDELCQKFGVTKVREVKATDTEALMSFVDTLEGKYAVPQSQPQPQETDPFA